MIMQNEDKVLEPTHTGWKKHVQHKKCNYNISKTVVNLQILKLEQEILELQRFRSEMKCDCYEEKIPRSFNAYDIMQATSLSDCFACEECNL